MKRRVKETNVDIHAGPRALRSREGNALIDAGSAFFFSPVRREHDCVRRRIVVSAARTCTKIGYLFSRGFILRVMLLPSKRG